MRQVGYLYNEDYTKFILSENHPMKPMRLKMVNSLISVYGLASRLNIYSSKQATSEQMCSYHHPSYISYLQTWVSPKSSKIVETYDVRNESLKLKLIDDIKLSQIFKVNQSFDCPGFEGLYNYCQLSAGSSIDAASMIITGQSDIAINWMGGFHHAKKTYASGFCYINDIVLCILELLKVYPKVLYLDIDVHHGDGVQQAFFHTNRVMTVSFHQYDPNFFPHTGHLRSTGIGLGKYHNVNVPLKKGIQDQQYVRLFKDIMQRVIQFHGPQVIVVQCGADSLSKDKLGELNLSIRAHGQCLNFMKSLNIPLILLGGGGYTIENVSRCWAYETGLMLGEEISNDIPHNDIFSYYYQKDNYKIHYTLDTVCSTNSLSYLHGIRQQIYQNLRQGDIRPSIGFHQPPKPIIQIQQQENENECGKQLKNRLFFEEGKGKNWGI